jgi:hypothetical protein
VLTNNQVDVPVVNHTILGFTSNRFVFELVVRALDTDQGRDIPKTMHKISAKPNPGVPRELLRSIYIDFCQERIGEGMGLVLGTLHIALRDRGSANSNPI